MLQCSVRSFPSENHVLQRSNIFSHSHPTQVGSPLVDTHNSGTLAVSASGGFLCWVESLILGLGVPTAIWIVSKLISLSVPAAVHSFLASPFLLWILGGVIVEWSFVIALWFVVRSRSSSLKTSVFGA
jgi:hypothetical protein